MTRTFDHHLDIVLLSDLVQLAQGVEFGELGGRPELVAYWNGLKDRPALARVQAQCEAWLKAC